ncbi:hypothetical protein CDD82_7847 [Ophiocordyceps australis]|uniref:chitinase n=1 Tax=Ophiocordyceps australis TaxID=1399860 RepID=A0A2C5YNW7_9HYPO|nr:hypothetical protein CDD82_7847 [Ophiocordyceps australis]
MLAVGWLVAALAMGQASLGMATAVRFSRREVAPGIDRRAAGEYVNMVYFASWTKDRYPATKLPVEDLTHVAYAFAQVDPSDGRAFAQNPGADVKDMYDGDDASEPGNNAYGHVKQLYKLKKQNRKLKVLLAIGGWPAAGHENDFAIMAADPVKRKNFAKTAVEMMRDYGFDGIDIDYEYPKGLQDSKTDQVPDFIAMLKDLRTELDAYGSKHGHHFLLTAAVGGSWWWYRHLTKFGKELNEVLDRLHVMTYDYAAGVKEVAHNANLLREAGTGKNAPAAQSAIEAYIGMGVAPEKLLLGMVLYGRAFQETSGLGGPANAHKLNAANAAAGSYEAGTYVYSALPRNGLPVQLDEEVVAAYTYDEATGEFVTFDSEETVARKMEWAKGKNLGGGFFWGAAGDKVGEGSLIARSKRGLGRLEGSENWLRYPDSRYENIARNLETGPVSSAGDEGVSKPARGMTTMTASLSAESSSTVVSMLESSSAAISTLESSSAAISTLQPSTTPMSTSQSSTSTLTTPQLDPASTTSTALASPPTPPSPIRFSTMRTAWANSTMSTASPKPSSTSSLATGSDAITTPAPKDKHAPASTVESTTVITITQCPPSVSDCSSAVTKTETRLVEPQATAVRGTVVKVLVVDLRVVVVCSKGGLCQCPRGLLCRVQEGEADEATPAGGVQGSGDESGVEGGAVPGPDAEWQDISDSGPGDNSGPEEASSAPLDNVGPEDAGRGQAGSRPLESMTTPAGPKSNLNPIHDVSGASKPAKPGFTIAIHGQGEPNNDNSPTQDKSRPVSPSANQHGPDSQATSAAPDTKLKCPTSHSVSPANEDDLFPPGSSSPEHQLPASSALGKPLDGDDNAGLWQPASAARPASARASQHGETANNAVKDSDDDEGFEDEVPSLTSPADGEDFGNDDSSSAAPDYNDSHISPAARNRVKVIQSIKIKLAKAKQNATAPHAAPCVGAGCVSAGGRAVESPMLLGGAAKTTLGASFACALGAMLMVL